MSERIFNVLFLCTGNSARSILAESILNKEGGGRFRAYSAGSLPKDDVNPYAIRVLDNFGYPVQGLRSKSWDEFERENAPTMDFVVTVCDNAAGEVCPIWPGHPARAHWGIEDPAAVEGSDVEKLTAFATAFGYLQNRIAAFVALPADEIDTSSLHHIGYLPGASAGSRG